MTSATQNLTQHIETIAGNLAYVLYYCKGVIPALTGKMSSE